MLLLRHPHDSLEMLLMKQKCPEDYQSDSSTRSKLLLLKQNIVKIQLITNYLITRKVLFEITHVCDTEIADASKICDFYEVKLICVQELCV